MDSLIEYPESLILTPPPSLRNRNFNNPKRKVWGPFVYQEGDKKIIGMELWDEGDLIHFSDGERARYFSYDRAEICGETVVYCKENTTFVIRPIDLSDAPEFGYNTGNPGLTPEQLINEAIAAFERE